MGKLSKIWHQLRMFTIPSRMKRVKYLKKKGYFRSVGDRVMINSFKIPLYANLISIGENVWIASDVTFITHDVIHYMLNGLDRRRKYTEKVGCINIGDNVFIGNGCRIMHGVDIGDNCVIAAGSIVTRDLEGNGVYAGVPAKRIGEFDKLLEKRDREEDLIGDTILKNHRSGFVSKDEEDYLWEQFNMKRKK